MTLPRYATYPGDQRHIVGELKGPGLNGLLWIATEATYFPADHTTYVEFDRYTPRES